MSRLHLSAVALQQHYKIIFFVVIILTVKALKKITSNEKPFEVFA